MQQQHSLQPSFNSPQQTQLLLDFSLTISQRCRNFIEYLLTISNQYQMQMASQPMTKELLLSALSYNFVYEKIETGRPICGKILPANTVVFVCYDCMLQDNSIICIQCFNKGNHKGHSYHKKTSTGTCDCGDEEIMKKEGFCPDHCSKGELDFEVGKEKTQIFIKQMKFLFFLLHLIKKLEDNQISNIFSEIFSQALAIYLKNFNQGSMFSNEMTSKLFSQNFCDIIPPQFKFKFRDLSVLILVLNFYELEEQCNLIVDLFVLLLARPKFKRQLIVSYFQVASENPYIWKSAIASRSYLFIPSYKLIGELIDSKEITPWSINVNNLPLECQFEEVDKMYGRYLIQLSRMSRLKFGVGQKFIKWVLNQGNIADFTGYEIFVPSNNLLENNEKYYTEFKYWYYLPKILKNIREQKQTLLKAMKDIVENLKARDEEIFQMTLFISKQRTLGFLIYEYFDGNPLKAIDAQFLKSVGLSYEILFRVLQSVLYVMRFYALASSNIQTNERFRHFTHYSIKNVSRRIISVDFELLLICLAGLTHLEFQKAEMIQGETIIQYEKIITIAQNKMPLEKLLALPIKFIDQLISDQIKMTEEDAYDRKKAVEMLIDYIGLLHENIITNHSSLNLRCCLDLNSKPQIINFYGSLLKSLRNVKNQDFRSMCNIFFERQSSPYLKEFFDENCQISDNRIFLRKQREHLFKAYNLSYLRSKKRFTSFSPYWEANMKQYHLNSIPNLQSSSEETHLKGCLAEIIFNQKFLQQIIMVTLEYQQILLQHIEAKKKDIGFFSSLIQELIRLNYTLKNKEIHQILTGIKKKPQIFQFMSQYTQKEIVIHLRQFQKVDDAEENQLKIKQKDQKSISAKAKRLLKFKEKQNKAIEKIIGENESKQGEIPNNEQDEYVCIFCRQSDQMEALQNLNYISRSTLFSQLCLDCIRPVFKITACGHYIHKKCFHLTYGNAERKVIYCDWCKFYSNIQLYSLHNKEFLIQQQNGSKSSTSMDENLKVQPLFLQNKELFQFLQKSQKAELSKILKTLTGAQPKQFYLLDQKLSLEQKLVQSLAAAILEEIVLNNMIPRAEYSTLRCIFLSLRSKLSSVNSLVQAVWKLTFDEPKNQYVKICRWAYKFTLLCVCFHLFAQEKADFMKQQFKKLKESLSKPLTDCIQKTIEFFINQNNAQGPFRPSQQQRQLIAAIFPKPYLIPASKNIEQLSKLSQKQCPNCKQKTNELAMCLICSFISCYGCKSKSLTSHTLKQHGWSAIFLRMDTGNPIYISGLKNYQFKSIYKNYLGEAYGLESWSYKKIRKCQFLLDVAEYEKLMKDLLKNRIEQQIDYYQKNKKKGKILEIIP